MSFLSKVIAKIFSDKERVKQNRPSSEDIKNSLRSGKGKDTVTMHRSSEPEKETKPKVDYQTKRGNVIVPEAFRKEVQKLDDKKLSKEALEIAKTGWIDPKVAESLLARFPEGSKAQDFIKKMLQRQGHNEPYIGDFHNAQWRTADRHELEDKIPHPVPQQVKDLKGTLGKDVPLGGSDPFMWMDLKYSITKNLLKSHYNKPLTINTRSDLIAHDDYMEAINPSKHKIRIHVLTAETGSWSTNIGRFLEPGAPNFQRRLMAAKKLYDAGYDVTMVVDVLEHSHLPEDLKKKLGSLHQVKQHAGKIKVAENKVKLTEAALKKILKAIGSDEEQKKAQ